MKDEIKQYIEEVSKKACLFDLLDYLEIQSPSSYTLPLEFKYFDKAYNYLVYEGTIWERLVQYDLDLLLGRSFCDIANEIGGGLWKRENGKLKINEGCYHRGENLAFSQFKNWAENSGLAQ